MHPTAVANVEPDGELIAPCVPPPSSLLVTTIERRHGTINFAELWKYRELVYFLTWRDIKVRYKQTILGAAWAIIQPLMTMFIFVILFGAMGRMSEYVEGSFALFVYAGLLPWQFFSNAVTQGGQSLISNANLISKVYFPRLIIPLSAVGAGLVDLGISLCVMIALMLGMGYVPGYQVVAVPVLLLGVLAASFGMAAMLSALTVAYRDFRYVVPFLLQIWMFVSPVGYPLAKVTETCREKLSWDPFTVEIVYSLNPLVGLITGIRWALLGEPLKAHCVVVSYLMAIALLFLGAFYFRRVERRFADIV